MEEEEENIYDDTIPKEVETEGTIQTNEAQNKPNEGTQADDPFSTAASSRPLVAPKPSTLKKQLQERSKIAGSPVPPDTNQVPSAPGLYYFDGERFIEPSPSETTVYAPSSAYCVVRRGKDTDDEDSGGYESDTSSSDQSQEDVQVRSQLTGLQTLNINIRLNVADLVRASISGRRRRRRTRKKAVHRARTSNYENTEHLFDQSRASGLRTVAEVHDTRSEKEPTENSLKSIVRGSDVAPPRPPRSFQNITKVETDHAVGNGQSQDAEPDDTYEPLGSVPTGQVATGGRLKRFNSEPASLPSSAATGSIADLAGTDVYYSKISDAAYDVYSSDVHIQSEVKSLMETHDWSYIYTDRQQAEDTLCDGEKPDGSFAVICENIEENHHFPFTLLLKYNGKVTRTPIKRVHDYRKKKLYELLNTKKDSVEKLVEHFRNKPLPDYKLKLR